MSEPGASLHLLRLVVRSRGVVQSFIDRYEAAIAKTSCHVFQCSVREGMA